MTIDSEDVTLNLSGVEILQDLDRKVIDDIASHIKLASFTVNEKIVEKGAMGDRIYFIFAGKVEVRFPDAQGDIKRRILLKTREVVGEILPEGPNYFSLLAEAVDDRFGYMMAVLDLQNRVVKAA